MTAFRNRADAGERLADLLVGAGVDADLVLGIPRGGLPVARPVADALDAELDIVVAAKIGAPKNPELAVGAVAADGSVYWNDDLIARLGVSDPYLDREQEREADTAAEKARTYRESPPEIAGKRVLVVDDGVATGATAIACLRRVRDAGASWVALAVPVGAPESLAALDADADAVYAIERPDAFGSVGRHYRYFDQVTDDEAMAYLDR